MGKQFKGRAKVCAMTMQLCEADELPCNQARSLPTHLVE